MGAKGGRARGKTAELELTDRERAKVALRRALDGTNYAAQVAAAKELIAQDHSPELVGVTVETARAELIARFDAIEERRRADGLACEACGTLLPRDQAAGRAGVPGKGRGTGHVLAKGAEWDMLFGRPSPPVTPTA